MARRKSENPAGSLDGYPWIKRAAQLRGSDPQMQFAAALITCAARTPHSTNTQKRLSLEPKTDDLLAQQSDDTFSGNAEPDHV